jgi:hypothetical protein
MANAVLVIAESGSGKSTSIESLNPQETFIVNPANKSLPFPGWRKKYTIWDKTINPKGNMYVKSGAAQVLAAMDYVSKSRPEIKTMVIDDFQYIFGFEFFDRVAEKGFEKFTEIGANLATISRKPIELRDDLTVIFLTHVEKGSDVEGNVSFKAKTIGRMVDEKLTLEGLFSIVLFGDSKKNKDGSIRYVFDTQTNGKNTCKSPRGMFSAQEIPNDLQYVVDSIIAYENGDPAPKLPTGFQQTSTTTEQKKVA